MKNGKDEAHTHPSYGMIRLSKFSGDSNFHGSSINCSGGISLLISRGDVVRKHYEEWYGATDRIVEIRMSAVQWAELITLSMNQGEGKPCTLVYTESDGHIRPEENQQNLRDNYLDDFKKDMRNVADIGDGMLSRLEELRNKKGSVTKKELTELTKMMESIQRELSSNIPFIHEQFKEKMDKVSLEAKGEVAHFIQRQIDAYGENVLMGIGEDLSKISISDKKKR